MISPRPDPAAIDHARAIADSAQRLSLAAATGTPCAPVRDLLGTDDVGLAYQVQQQLTAERLARGARIMGRKIGLTSAVVQRQLGVDEPDFGVLFDDMGRTDGEPIPTDALIQPKAEAEIAFGLCADLDSDAIDIEQVRDAIAWGSAAIEIVDSRIRDWDISITDTIADNASSGMFVLARQRWELKDFQPSRLTMTMVRDASIISQGDGRDCLGDPLGAVAWLANTARKLGAPLRAGEVVLSGALGPMVGVHPGDTVTAHLSILGTVAANFAPSEET